MPRNQLKIFWPLRLVAIATVVLPAAAFVYTTWSNSERIEAQAIERQERALDVQQEHALNTLQTVERAIAEINEVLRGLSDEEIRQKEADFYLRFKRTQQALPQAESIWAFGADGRPLVSSTIFPVPRDLNNSDRSYFAAQREADAGTFISEVLKARIGSMQFFVLSGRREGAAAGVFSGIIAVTVTPDYFAGFYRKVSRGADTFALVRNDGRFLARYPDVPFDEESRASALADLIKQQPVSGAFIGRSPFDGIERRIAFRKVAGQPVYVTTGLETDSLSAELWNTAFLQLAVGLPIVFAVFLLALYALHRAEQFQEENARRTAAENALKQAQRLEAIGQLTGGVAHDFNNLLMVVDGNIGRLKRHLGGDNPVAGRAIAAMETAVARGTALTRQLLSFSRRQTHEAVVIDLAQRLPVVREMLQSSLRGDIAIEIELDPDLWRIKVDATEFELALLNLAVNARDAMPRGGRLRIAARNLALNDNAANGLRGDFVRVSVTDTGSGIAEDVLARVFDPFFTTKEVGKGTGLGLSQVYGFANQAGGTATIESKPGVGTTVSLVLPRALDVAETPAETPEPAADSARSGKVLLVEDNPDVAAVTTGLLEELGYSVVHRHDVATAQDILRTSADSFAFVLSDIVMPGTLSGLDLAMWVRERFGRELPIILTTGYSERTQAAADAGLAILRKPFGLGELRKTIDERLGRPPG